MAIAHENWTKRRFDFQGMEGERVWDVDDAGSEIEASAAPGIPSIGTGWPSVGGATAEAPRVEAGEGPRSYVVTVAYKSDNPAPGGDGVDVNLNEPPPFEQFPYQNPYVQWNRGETSSDFDTDAFGNTMANTAATAFEPLQKTIIANGFTLYRWEFEFDLDKAMEYEGFTNEAAVTVHRLGTFPADTLLLKMYAPTTTINEVKSGPAQPQTMAILCAYAFEIDYRGFVWRIANKGRYGYWNDNGTVKLGEFYLNGQPIPDPIFLDAKGKPLDKATPYKVTQHCYDYVDCDKGVGGVYEEKDNFSWIKYRKYKTKLFGGLGVFR